MSGPADSDLVRAVLAGDQKAFAILVDRYQERLFRRALALLGDPDPAADMVQETLIRAYTGLAGADPERFAAWVHRILRNMCLDELKSPRQRTAALPGHLAASVDPARDLDRHELADSLGQALDTLGPTVREAFVLKHVEGLSYDEMSSLTGVAVGALKMRVKRAREALREVLQPLHGDPSL
jgi:RNA polymerase sigma-70 factor, ECF subfamily